MKKTLLTIMILASGVFALHAQDKPATPAAANPNGPKFKWEKTTNDFGEIKQDVPATAEFKFTNVGKEPLIIKEAKATCGCTVPDYSKDPIAPGKSGVIKATYNAHNPGAFEKSVNVTSNVSDDKVELKLKGSVNPSAVPPVGK